MDEAILLLPANAKLIAKQEVAGMLCVIFEINGVRYGTSHPLPARVEVEAPQGTA